MASLSAALDCGSRHTFLLCLLVILTTFCGQGGICWNVQKLDAVSSLMLAFDLPCLRKQLQTPHIFLLCQAISQMLRTIAFLLPQAVAYHVVSAAGAPFPGLKHIAKYSSLPTK